MYRDGFDDRQPQFNPTEFFEKALVQAREQTRLTEEVAERRKKEFLELYEMAQSRGGVDPATLMMMFNQFSQKPSADASSAAMDALKETIKRMEEEIRRDRRRGGDAFGDLPRLPAFPPMQPEGGSAADTVKAVAETFKAMVPPHQPGLTAQDVLAIVQASKTQEKPATSVTEMLTTAVSLVPAIRQVLGLDAQERRMDELMRQLREERSKPLDLLGEIQKLRAVKEMGREISGATTSELASTVKEFVKAAPFLFGMVQASRGSGGHAPAAPPPQPLPAAPAQQQIAPPKKETPKLVLPDGMDDDFAALSNAADDAATFGAAMTVVGKLADDAQWSPHLQTGLAAIKAGQKTKASLFVRQLFTALSKAGALVESRVADVVRIFEERFEDLAAMAGASGGEEAAP